MGHIDTLAFPGQGLGGTLSTEIGLLTQLTFITIQQNNVKGNECIYSAYYPLYIMIA
jgi:hypothetical protein